MQMIEYWEWFEHYKPLSNPLQDGTERLETYGKELELVVQYASMNNNHVWTELDDGSIVNGYHTVNRSCYYITKVPWTTDVEVHDEELESIYAHDDSKLPEDELADRYWRPENYLL